MKTGGDMALMTCRTLAAAPILVLLLGVTSARAQGPGMDAETLFNTGLNHLREGRTQDAVEFFKKAIKADGKNPYFHKGLGQAYLRLGKYDDAVTSFRKALAINPYYTDVHNDLGAALAASGKPAEGRREFLGAFSDPTNPTPEMTARNIGATYFEEHNYPEALRWFRTSMERNNHFPDAYVRSADTLVAMGKLDDAVAVLESAEKVLAEDLGVSLALGEAYYRAGRFADARSRLERVASKDPIGSGGRRASELLRNLSK